MMEIYKKCAKGLEIFLNLVYNEKKYNLYQKILLCPNVLRELI